MGGPHCCGLIPHLELANHPALVGTPVVVADLGCGEPAVKQSQGGARVLACSAEAAEFGVRRGITMRNAEQLCPSATLLEPQPEETARLRERLAGALYDLAPAVEVLDDGVAWINLEGLPAALKSEAVREMRRRLRAGVFVEPRLGLAPGPFAAMVAARRAAPGRVVQVDDARRFLAPLPASELDLDPDLHDRLDLLGLRTLGQVAEIGPRRLESQLGPPGRRAVLLARGDEPEPIKPWRAPRCLAAHRQLEPPVDDREALLFVARALCADLAADFGLRGAGAKRVRVKLGVEGVAVPEQRDALVRHALSSTAELFGLVSSWLRDWQPAAPVNSVVVEVPELEPAGRRQLRLWVGGDGAAEEVEAALERLQERHGEQVAVRVKRTLVTSGIAEQRYRMIPL